MVFEKKTHSFTSAIAVGLALAVVLTAFNATAQFGRGRGPQLAPEKVEAAIALEAKGVARDLALSKDVAEQLVAAYRDARHSHQKGMAELFGQGGGGGGMGRFMEMQELSEKEGAKLKAATEAFLSEKQAAKALESLGTFSRQWDRFVDTLVGFQLEEAPLYSGLGFVRSYVVDSEKARSEAMANMDFQSMRGATQELKAALDTSLTGILSEIQVASWKEATTFRGPRGGGQRRGAGEGPGPGHGGGGGQGHN